MAMPYPGAAGGMWRHVTAVADDDRLGDEDRARIFGASAITGDGRCRRDHPQRLRTNRKSPPSWPARRMSEYCGVWSAFSTTGRLMAS